MFKTSRVTRRKFSAGNRRGHRGGRGRALPGAGKRFRGEREDRDRPHRRAQPGDAEPQGLPMAQPAAVCDVDKDVLAKAAKLMQTAACRSRRPSPTSASCSTARTSTRS